MTSDHIDFQDAAEDGVILIDSHEKTLRIAYIYWHNAEGRGGLFDAVDKLHERGWSFGQGDLRLNRTLDMFYLAQLGYGYYHQADVEDGRAYFIDAFDDYCTDFGELLAEDVWKEYYSLEFLLQPATARFWRLPNLRDLPSSNNPIGKLRDKPVGHYVASTGAASQGGPDYFGIFVAQGGYDVWEWERHYTPERWHAVSVVALEPDLDGTARSELGWCGWPDGGAGSLAAQRGWVPELGSEEEVEFMAAVAAKETECCDMDALNYSVRSHILLAMLHLAFLPESQREEFGKKMRQGVLEKGRLDKTTMDEWIENVLGVIEPYTLEQKVFPATNDGRTALLRRVLAENGQLFARGGWQFGKRGPARGFKFDLKNSVETRRKN